MDAPLRFAQLLLAHDHDGTEVLIGLDTEGRPLAYDAAQKTWAPVPHHPASAAAVPHEPFAPDAWVVDSTRPKADQIGQVIERAHLRRPDTEEPQPYAVVKVPERGADHLHRATDRGVALMLAAFVGRVLLRLAVRVAGAGCAAGEG